MSDLVERLEPCPFCGGTDDADNAVMEPKVFVEEFQAPIRVHAYQVKCWCGAEAAAAFSRQGAVGEWNRRAESPDLTRLRSEVERLTTARVADARVEKALENDLMDARTRAMGAEAEVERLTRERDEAWMNGAKAASMYHVREAEWHMRNAPSSGTGRVAQHQYYAERVIETANTLFNELKEKDNGKTE